MSLAVSAGAVATPCVLVVTVSAVRPPAKLALGPVPGAVNTTSSFASGQPPVSTTVASRGSAKAVPTLANCGDPAVTWRPASVPVQPGLAEATGAKGREAAVTPRPARGRAASKASAGTQRAEPRAGPFMLHLH